MHELTCQILTNQSTELDVERDQRVTMVRKGLPRLCFLKKTGWILASEVSLKSKS